MIPHHIHSLATEILESYNYSSPPVDPYQIASEEGIFLTKIKTNNLFFARIEFLKDYGKYVIYYPEHENNISSPIIRFSLAHELGHYYIPEHRELLENGRTHSSNTRTITNNLIEIEANHFASLLLIPSFVLNSFVKKYHCITFFKILEIAKTCNCSITSTAIRYINFTDSPSILVCSEDNTIKWAACSDAAKSLGCHWVQNIPIKSLTSKINKPGEIQEDEDVIYKWFPNCKTKGSIWEEVYKLPVLNWVLTLLTINAD